MITRIERIILHNKSRLVVELAAAGKVRPYSTVEAIYQLQLDSLNEVRRSKGAYQSLFKWDSKTTDDFFGAVPLPLNERGEYD